MKLGILKIIIFSFTLFFTNTLSIVALDKIQSVPLINLEELSPTFEEDKDELEKIEEENTNLNNMENIPVENKIKKKDKIYINIIALDKISAKTSTIRLAIGEESFKTEVEKTTGHRDRSLRSGRPLGWRKQK